MGQEVQGVIGITGVKEIGDNKFYKVHIKSKNNSTILYLPHSEEVEDFRDHPDVSVIYEEKEICGETYNCIKDIKKLD